MEHRQLRRHHSLRNPEAGLNFPGAHGTRFKTPREPPAPLASAVQTLALPLASPSSRRSQSKGSPV